MRVKIQAVERDKCPYCGSTTVDCDGRDSDYRINETWYEMYCDNCGRYWDEVYRFEFKGIRISDDEFVTPANIGVEVEVDE